MPLVSCRRRLAADWTFAHCEDPVVDGCLTQRVVNKLRCRVMVLHLISSLWSRNSQGMLETRRVAKNVDTRGDFVAVVLVHVADLATSLARTNPSVRRFHKFENRVASQDSQAR
jgi:hypothetical protein